MLPVRGMTTGLPELLEQSALVTKSKYLVSFADGGDCHCGYGEVQYRVGILAEQPGDDAAQPSRQFLRLRRNIVDNNLDGPRLQDVGKRFAQHGDQRERQRFPVRPHKVDDPQPS